MSRPGVLVVEVKMEISVLVQSLKSSISSSTSYQLDKNFWEVALGDGKLGPEAKPRIHPNQTKIVDSSIWKLDSESDLNFLIREKFFLFLLLFEFWQLSPFLPKSWKIEMNDIDPKVLIISLIRWRESYRRSRKNTNIMSRKYFLDNDKCFWK